MCTHLHHQWVRHDRRLPRLQLWGLRVAGEGWMAVKAVCNHTHSVRIDPYTTSNGGRGRSRDHKQRYGLLVGVRMLWSCCCVSGGSAANAATMSTNSVSPWLTPSTGSGSSIAYSTVALAGRLR